MPRAHLPRSLKTGLILVVGVFTACALPAAIAGASNPARSVLTTTASSAATPAPTAAATGSQSGSTALFVLLLVGLFLLVGVPYLIDLIWTNKRQDKVLELARTKQESLSETEFDHLISRATRGTDGLNRALMAFAVIGIFAAALFYILVKNPNIKSSDIVGNAISALITLLTAIVAFYFGTRSAQTSAEASQPRTLPGPSPVPPVEEVPVEEMPVEEPTVEKAPVEETPLEEVPVEEVPVEGTPVDEMPVTEEEGEESGKPRNPRPH